MPSSNPSLNGINCLILAACSAAKTPIAAPNIPRDVKIEPTRLSLS
jgi:hypothetical protein